MKNHDSIIFRFWTESGINSLLAILIAKSENSTAYEAEPFPNFISKINNISQLSKNFPQNFKNNWHNPYAYYLYSATNTPTLALWWARPNILLESPKYHGAQPQSSVSSLIFCNLPLSLQKQWNKWTLPSPPLNLQSCSLPRCSYLLNSLLLKSLLFFVMYQINSERLNFPSIYPDFSRYIFSLG